MMKHNSRYYTRKMAVLCLIAVTGAAMLTGCKKKEKINPSSTHTTAAVETMEKETESEPEAKVEATTEAAKETEAAKNITAKKNLYESGKVSIEYPTVVNVSDPAAAEAIDALMKEHALAVLKAYAVDETKDDLNVTCQVMGADRNRITIVYKGTLTKDGSRDSSNIFYTSTVDVQNLKNVRLSKYADPYTLAGYVLSEDCIFPDADAAQKEILMKEKNNRTLDQYTKLFTNADFSENGDFPEVFSYEHEGNIYFSVPFSHEAGDYAIVMFSPDGK
ncbi:MAG: DUF4163 domain-containing protein [Brotaphodocola sp.]